MKKLIPKYQEGRSLHSEPERDWLMDWTKKHFSKVSTAGEVMSKIPGGVNPIKITQYAADFTGIPGLINSFIGNPMNLPSNEVEAAAIPIIGGVQPITKSISEKLLNTKSELQNIIPKNSPLEKTFNISSSNFKTFTPIPEQSNYYRIGENIKIPQEYGNGYTEITQKNLNPILSRMKVNNEGSSIDRTLFSNKEVFLLKNIKDFEPDLPRLTSELHYKKRLEGIIPQHQTVTITADEFNNPHMTRNFQVQKKSPGDYLYQSNYENLSQVNIDEAKRTLETAHKAGLRFDFKGGNNTLYNSKTGGFNFIDTGIASREYNTMDPIQAFRQHLTRGIDNSLGLLPYTSSTPGIRLSKTPLFGPDWIKKRGLTIGTAGVAVGVGASQD